MRRRRRATREQCSKAIEAVHDLRWGSGFVENARKAHTGLDAVSAEIEVPEPLRRKLDELRAQTKKESREPR